MAQPGVEDWRLRDEAYLASENATFDGIETAMRAFQAGATAEQLAEFAKEENPLNDDRMAALRSAVRDCIVDDDKSKMKKFTEALLAHAAVFPQAVDIVWRNLREKSGSGDDELESLRIKGFDFVRIDGADRTKYDNADVEALANVLFYEHKEKDLYTGHHAMLLGLTFNFPAREYCDGGVIGEATMVDVWDVGDEVAPPPLSPSLSLSPS